jgi:hypothetical protein
LVYNNSTSVAFGGGIRTEDGSVTIYQSTFSNNLGGAALSQSSSSVDVQNSIAWGNYSGFLGSFSAATCNIDQSGNAGDNVDPKFVDSDADDYHLGTNSPAIDACDAGSSVDLEGYSRPIREKYDMGAFEEKIKAFLPLVIKNG